MMMLMMCLPASFDYCRYYCRPYRILTTYEKLANDKFVSYKLI